VRKLWAVAWLAGSSGFSDESALEVAPPAWQPAYGVHDNALYKSTFFTFFTFIIFTVLIKIAHWLI